MADPALSTSPLDAWRITLRRRTGRIVEAATAIALSAPAIVTMLLFLFGPLLAVIVFSFTDWQFGAATFEFIGLGNYAVLAADPLFWRSLTNTLIYVAVVVPGSVLLGLITALLIDAGQSGRTVYQAILFLPVMATISAIAISWEVMLHPLIGVVNAILGIFGLPGHQWLNDPNTVLLALCIIGIWQYAGFCMVLFVAGLRVIPAELHEAADIDGADGVWDRFATVTWPLLGPVTMFVLVVVAVRAFQVFDIVAVLTQGGPGISSQVLLYTIYSEAFRYLRTGYGAALTVVFLVIVLSLMLTQARTLEKRTHYQ